MSDELSAKVVKWVQREGAEAQKSSGPPPAAGAEVEAGAVNDDGEERVGVEKEASEVLGLLVKAKPSALPSVAGGSGGSGDEWAAVVGG